MNPAVYWMDVSDASYYITNEKKKKTIKVAKWGTPKKLKKNKKKPNITNPNLT